VDQVFYVYEHWRPDRGECFYVGKGRGNRANIMRRRNSHHTAIQLKLSRMGLCVEVKLVSTELTEMEAFALEKERIAFWRADGADLANFTDGGEGASGYRHSEDTLALLSSIKKGKKPSPEVVAKRAAAIKAKGHKRSDEWREARRAQFIGIPLKEEHKAKLRGPKSEEHKAKLSAAHKGVKLKPEHAAKVAVAVRGRKYSEEVLANRRAAWTPEMKVAQGLRSAEAHRNRSDTAKAERSLKLKAAWVRRKAAKAAQEH